MAPYACSKCKEIGHNRQTCPALGGQKSPGGRGGEAAKYMRAHGGTFRTVGDRFGITHQAVEYAWRALGYGDTPTQIAWAERRARILELVNRGMTAPEIAAELGMRVQVVHRAAGLAGVSVAPVPTTTVRLRDKIEAIAARVDAGELTITQAGHELGVSPDFISPFVKVDVNHRRKRDFRSFDDDGRSKSERASEIVDQGVDATTAARQFGISDRSIYQWRKRHGLPTSLAKRLGRRRARSA